jgi:membrane fusion protein, multidrug efflux system
LRHDIEVASFAQRIRKWLALGGLGLILASGVGLLLAAEHGDSGGGPPQRRENPEQRVSREAAPVTVARVEQHDVPFEINAVGTVEASSTVDIVPQASGRITQVAFTEGAFVTAGDLLFEIDERPYRAALAQAEAALVRSNTLAAQREVEAQRYLELQGQGIATEQQRKQAVADAAAARADVEAAQAELASARLSLAFTRITAPISGKTGALLVHAGSVVDAKTTSPMVVIRRLTPAQVRFAIPERYITVLREGMAGGAMPVRALAHGERSMSARGELTFMENSIDPATGTLAVKATFANAQLELWPGAAVDVVLGLSTDRNALVVPEAAVRDSQTGKYVFVVNADRVVTQRPVEVARIAASWALIEHGLEVGEWVVTDGQVRLRNGMNVLIESLPRTEHLPAGEPHAKEQDSP